MVNYIGTVKQHMQKQLHYHVHQGNISCSISALANRAELQKCSEKVKAYKANKEELPYVKDKNSIFKMILQYFLNAI